MSKQHLTFSRLAFLLSPLLLLILQTGCSSGMKPPITTQVERSGLDVVIIPEGQRAAFFKDSGSMERFCAAPEADVADVFGGGITFGASEGDISESFGDSKSEGAVALGGRGPATLLTRELLYRACDRARVSPERLPTEQCDPHSRWCNWR